MSQRHFAGITSRSLCIIFAAAVLLCTLPVDSAPANRIHPFAKFTKGETLRYQIETRVSTSGTLTTPIVNPEAASQVKQSVSVIVRLDVLDVQSGPSGTAGKVRVRITYEKSKATSESDAYDPGAAALEAQYDSLEGRSMEFTVDPGGKLSNITGLDDLLSNPSTAATVRSWLNGISSSQSFPKEGIQIGQKWKDQRSLEGTPLAGLTWRTESTYLHDEPCTPAKSSEVPDAAPPSPTTDATCAAIVTRFEIFRRGSAHGDATPNDYLHNGLRTSGTWTGAGESLDMISLANGRVVRSTQNGAQNMDFEIISAASGSKLHYVGRVENQSEITLLPKDSPSRPQP